MQFDFPAQLQNKDETVLGVMGICDWVGEGLAIPEGENVDLLEIKFIQELRDDHRLQALTYSALLSIEKGAPCSGMLYNARTEETEVFKIEAERAIDFLLDIAKFKFDGTLNDPLEIEACMAILSHPDSSEEDASHTNKRPRLPIIAVAENRASLLLESEPVTNDATIL
mmetsp:Transcript_18669/g.46874  ORF Transcript_18669/g.46874 Transcript_18669/m.46874 type:complete len:169 (+) Transcript_18669:1894-2400(+)